MFDFSQVNILPVIINEQKERKNIEEVAILYFYNILKDTIERKCLKIAL